MQVSLMGNSATAWGGQKRRRQVAPLCLSEAFTFARKNEEEESEREDNKTRNEKKN